MSALKLGLPKGSLEQMTIEMMKKAGWRVSVGSRSYFPSIATSSSEHSTAELQEWTGPQRTAPTSKSSAT